ncbi:hypothetical protein [Methylobacterium sp. Leaf118]|uniref:hypothetical protein n=1 Tax=Methylobacterium sp. Leaf118 TaxID=2876562 RepID=UPI001E29FE2F|nr:hypothetical protein [Methylobacterium sp. Leaf118]
MSTQSQFLHISLYGVAPRKGAPEWATVDGITREGARAAGAARHVPYPTAPTLLFGVSPLDVGILATERAAQARDTKGRRLRRDGAVLMAAVLSYPVPRTLVEDRNAPDAADCYGAWRDAALAWCRSRFGDTLLSVVEHRDEDYCHLHAYAVPSLTPTNCLDWEAIHPGRAALRRAEAERKGKTEQRADYLAAMRALQDDYHVRVSRGFGHARLGPKRTRLQRTLYLAERDAARRRTALEQTYDAARARLREVVEAEVRQDFLTVLAEAKQRLRTLAEARADDRDRIAELSAAYSSLQDEVASLCDDLGKPYGH